MKSVAVLMVLVGSATAQPIADGYALAFHDHAIVVRKGAVEATVIAADGLTSAKYDPKAGTVAIEYDSRWCTIPNTTIVTFASLKAKLENTPALALHRKKSWKLALAGFQRAIAVDPSWPLPAYNAASAQQLLGDKDGAIATLAPWLKAHPLTTFVQIHQDAELAPLADRAEVRAAGAKQPGDVEVTADGIVGEVAFSEELNLVAVARDEGSWGNYQFSREIQIFNLGGGQGAALPLVMFPETSSDCYDSSGARGAGCVYVPGAKTALAERAAAVQRILRDLGFKRATIEAETSSSNDGVKIKKSFPKHKLGFVSVDNAFRVLRGNTELATGIVALGRLQNVTYVEEPNAMIVRSFRAGAEGCEGTDPTAVEVVPLKNP